MYADKVTMVPPTYAQEVGREGKGGRGESVGRRLGRAWIGTAGERWRGVCGQGDDGVAHLCTRGRPGGKRRTEWRLGREHEVGNQMRDGAVRPDKAKTALPAYA